MTPFHDFSSLQEIQIEVSFVPFLRVEEHREQQQCLIENDFENSLESQYENEMESSSEIEVIMS